MARYTRDGLKQATTIFEAAAWAYGVEVTCSRCEQRAVFDPYGLWWLFHRKGWSDDFRSAREKLWCHRCSKSAGHRIRPRWISIVKEQPTHATLPRPDPREWKRAINRFRG